jgi:hypothetical protein
MRQPGDGIAPRQPDRGADEHTVVNRNALPHSHAVAHADGG